MDLGTVPEIAEAGYGTHVCWVLYPSFLGTVPKKISVWVRYLKTREIGTVPKFCVKNYQFGYGTQKFVPDKTRYRTQKTLGTVPKNFHFRYRTQALKKCKNAIKWVP